MSTMTKDNKKIPVAVSEEVSLAVTSGAGEASSSRPINCLGGTYFYSASIINRKNVFVTPEYLDSLVNAINLAELQKDVKNLAFVIMPNYFYWIFRLSAKDDDPMPVYKDVKKQVALDIIENLKTECRHPEEPFEQLDLFKSNAKVSRSNPRKILWTFKTEAKKIDPNKRYRVWENKSRLFLLDTEEKIRRNAQFIKDAPLTDRWQLVSSALDYPYLYLSDEIQEKIA